MSDLVFGTLVDGADVERVVVDHLRRWGPTHLARQSRRTQSGPDPLALEPWNSHTTGTRVEARDVADQLPGLLVINGGTVGDLVRRGDGAVTISWSVGASVIVGGPDRLETARLVRLHTGAITQVLFQHARLNLSALGIDAKARIVSVQGVGYDDLPFEDDRTLQAGFVRFTVQVDEAVNAYGGPSEPIESAPPALPVIQAPIGVAVDLEVTAP